LTVTASSAGRYNKFLVSLFGTASVGVTTYGHNASWVPLALSAIAAAVVYLVPNVPPAAVAAAAPQPPASP
jgi:hypothetical protein